jgi:hypothetical protein
MPCRDCLHYLPSEVALKPRSGLVGRPWSAEQGPPEGDATAERDASAPATVAGAHCAGRSPYGGPSSHAPERYGYCNAAPTLQTRARMFSAAQAPCWLPETRCQEKPQ